MATEQDKQRYIDDTARRGGYVLDYHKVMAKPDCDVLGAPDGLLPEAGVVAFQHGLDAWRQATGATGIEPAAAVPGNGSGR